MNFWYFKFEGRFKQHSPRYGCKGVFSGCLVPEESYEKAHILFLNALEENDIELVEINESFDVNGAELDPEDENNDFWIDWYNETKSAGEVVFDKWHVFDE